MYTFVTSPGANDFFHPLLLWIQDFELLAGVLPDRTREMRSLPPSRVHPDVWIGVFIFL